MSNLGEFIFRGTGSICVSDTGTPGTGDNFYLSMYADGAPSTLETVLSPTTQSWFNFNGNLEIDVFDGFTFDQTQLLTDVNFTTAAMWMTVYDGALGENIVDMSASAANSVVRINP
jgi:hypothetical protein